MSAPAEATLLLVAHGTASAAGVATAHALATAVSGRGPNVALAFLDVASPRLPDVLAATPPPAVVVPLLLSTGYHVQHDIPESVGARPGFTIARHLGPDPLLTEAMLDRLPAGTEAAGAASVLLVGTGSSREGAAVELAAAASLAAERLGRAVSTATMADDLDAVLAALPGPVVVLTYLLAEGRFVDVLRATADRTEGQVVVGEPIGVHPRLVELVLRRYSTTLLPSSPAAAPDGARLGRGPAS